MQFEIYLYIESKKPEDRDTNQNGNTVKPPFTIVQYRIRLPL